MPQETRTDFFALHPEDCICNGHKKYAELAARLEMLNTQITADATAEMIPEFEAGLAERHKVQMEMEELRFGSE